MLYRQNCPYRFSTFTHASLKRRLASLLRFLLSLVLLPQLLAYAQSVHQLYYNNVSWVDQNLTALAGGPVPAQETGIAAFYTTPNQQFHVYYVAASDQHVHQLYWNRVNWSDQDLTAVTGGMSAGLATEVSGFAIGNLQYVFFLGSDLHVHMYSYNNIGWSDQDITVAGGGVTTDFQNMLAFATKPNNQFHVYYLANNSNAVHQLYFNGTNWSDQNLSALTGLLGNRTWTSGFAIGNQQHVFLSGYDPSDNVHLYHLYYNNIKWISQDVTAKVGGLPLGAATGISAFRVPGTSQIEAYAITNDFDVHQYTFKSGAWSDIDLTATTGGPGGAALSQITACATTPNKQFHMFYEPPTFGDVYQNYFNNISWSSEDLGAPSFQSGGMASFAISNYQHVFYLGP